MRELRTENIRVRLTAQERKYIEDNMKKHKETNISEYIREKVLTDAVYLSLKRRKEAEDLRYEIHKIGVNVNQIAKRYNEGTPFYSDPKKLQEDLESIKTLLEQYLRERNR